MRNFINKCSDYLNKLVVSVGCVIFFVLVVATIIQVLCRYFLKVSVPWTEELARFAFIWATMLGASVLVKTKGHPAVDVLTGKLKGVATQWLAVHFVKQGIRVNAIAPGFLSTQQNKTLLWNEDGSPTPRTGKILAATPMGRFGRPEELIGAVLFLLDDKAASFVTGVVLPIDGGFSAYSGV